MPAKRGLQRIGGRDGCGHLFRLDRRSDRGINALTPLTSSSGGVTRRRPLVIKPHIIPIFPLKHDRGVRVPMHRVSRIHQSVAAAPRWRGGGRRRRARSRPTSTPAQSPQNLRACVTSTALAASCRIRSAEHGGSARASGLTICPAGVGSVAPARSDDSTSLWFGRVARQSRDTRTAWARAEFGDPARSQTIGFAGSPTSRTARASALSTDLDLHDTDCAISSSLSPGAWWGTCTSRTQSG